MIPENKENIRKDIHDHDLIHIKNIKNNKKIINNISIEKIDQNRKIKNKEADQEIENKNKDKRVDKKDKNNEAFRKKQLIMIKKILDRLQKKKRKRIINIKIMINENNLDNQIKKIHISNKDDKYNE